MSEVTSGEEGSSGPPLVDELLCFITNKLGHMDPDTIVTLCLQNFVEKEIEASKDVLFSLLCDDNAHTSLVKRRKGKGNESKSVRNMHDMFQLLQEKGEDQCPSLLPLI